MAKRTSRRQGPFRKGKRWAIDIIDSKNVRHRPTFATKEEAQRAFDDIKAQKAAGEFYANAATATLNDALDLLVNRTMTGKNRKPSKATSNRVKSIIDTHLREDLGWRKLSEFPASRMKFVKDWLDEKATSLATSSVAHLHSALKLALDLAIANEMLGAPNPMTTFKVGVPVGQDPEPRRALTLDEISAMVRGTMARVKHERELTFKSRFVITMLGLLAGLRDQECSGLCWDCVDMDGRMLFVRRKVTRVDRNGKNAWALEEGTKTGELGFRDIPMSPALHAVLSDYREQLRAAGYPVEGKVLVLRTERVDCIRPDAIMTQHWAAIAEKAGFVGRDGNGLTYYALRHTAACMWRTIGVDLEHLKDLMGHTDIQTTSKRYLHKTPTFNVLRREVEALGFERTPEGLIDALGIVLAQRWREEGIEMPCSPPVAMMPRLGYQGEHEQALLAGPAGAGNGQLIDLEPDAITTSTIPPIRSLKELREWQRSEAKRLASLGWKYSRIEQEIGVDRTTISSWVRSADEQIWLRKLSYAARADLREQARRMRIEQDATNTEIGRALNVAPNRVAIWLRGLPMKNWRRAATQKYLRHETLIRRRIAEGKTLPAIARELGFPRDTGLRQFADRLGLDYRKRTRPMARNPGQQVLADQRQSAVSGTDHDELDEAEAAA